MKITNFQRWILGKIFRKIVTQGPDHMDNIRDVYSLLRESAEEEFYEDNAPTLDSFMFDCFKTTQAYRYYLKDNYYSSFIYGAKRQI